MKHLARFVMMFAAALSLVAISRGYYAGILWLLEHDWKPWHFGLLVAAIAALAVTIIFRK